jgi:2-oxoglutarate dehydrogenase E2 component (dihydrolipoamide succinyltransferase)
MGESIAEGTIVRWIKKVGDAIDKDEPLFEISTDKVDAEIPSPGAGVLLDIKVKEGETVPVNSVVAIIGAAGEKAAGPAGPAASAAPTASASSTAQASSAGPATVDDLRRTKSSPVVRKIAQEHQIDISGLDGTGISGRVTKKDILAFVESGAAARTVAPAAGVRIEKMGVMRKKIAEHMVASVRTSPHVFSAYEVDFSKIEKIRQAKKAQYEAAGARLTYTAFIAKATVDVIRQFPFTNASIDGDNIVYKRDINLGIAVALESGLIVPVIKNADERNLLGLCRAIQDLSGRARSKNLKPEDVQGGTFTITNPGIFGALFGLPIISQPQVAILGVGSIDKRAVVIDDMIAIHPMCYLTLGFDHRLIDGADAGRFLQALKARLEQFDETTV